MLDGDARGPFQLWCRQLQEFSPLAKSFGHPFMSAIVKC